MKWFWGTILILIGLIILGLNTNYIDHSQLIKIASLWPLLLIIYGAALIFHRFRYGWIITLLVIISSFALLAALLNGKISYKKYYGSRQTHKFSADLKDTTQNAKITVDSGAVNLQLSSSDTKLIEGKLVSNYLDPDLKVNFNDTQAEATLNANYYARWPYGKNDLNVNITDQIPTQLTLNVGASKINANLTKIILEKLDVNAGASDMDIQIGEQIRNGAKLTFSSGASNIHLLVPKFLGVEVRNESPVSTFHFENSAKTDNKTYQSKNYLNANKKIKVDISSGASTIEITSY